MSEDEAMDFPIIKALALSAWNTETNPWSSVDRTSDGYIAQEMYRRRKENV